MSADFLEVLFERTEGGVLNICALGGGPPETWWIDSPDGIYDLPARALDRDLFFGVATRRARVQGRGGVEDCKQIPALWLDVDYATGVHAAEGLPTEQEAEDVLHRAEEFLPPPTLWVETGGGIHLYWVLERPLDAQSPATEELLKRWHLFWTERFEVHHLDNVYDVPRMMRLPGSTNQKYGTEVTWRGHGGQVYGINRLADRLPALLAPEAPARLNEGQRDLPGFERPGTWYDQTQTCDAVFEQAGWTRAHRNRRGQLWKRPGSSNDVGAIVYDDTGRAQVFSSSVPGAEHDRHYTPFGLFALLLHGADFQAATRAAAALRPGNPSPEPLRAPQSEIQRRPAPTLPGDPQEGDTDDPGGQSGALPTLPTEWYERRHILTQIRDAAWSWTVSPDAVLGCVLARVAWMTSPEWRIGSVGAGLGTLNTMAMLVGPPASGKSKSIRLAELLVPLQSTHEEEYAEHPLLASGEGMVKAFFKFKKDDQGQKRWLQTTKGVLFVTDEAGGVLSMLHRQGQTLDTILRGFATGDSIGFTYSSERNEGLKLPRASYRACAIAGIQPGIALTLLTGQQAEMGTPHRFVWLSTVAGPGMQDRDHDPEPDPLWGPIGEPNDVLGGVLTVPSRVVAESIERARAVQSGALVLTELEGHDPYTRLKVAAVLGVLDGRTNVSEEDWELASEVVEVSARIRLQLIELGTNAKRRAERYEDNRQKTVRAVATVEAHTRLGMEQVAMAARTKMEDNPEWSWSELRRSFRSDKRALLDQAKAAGLLADLHEYDE